jgi:GNAT superfamily N-acetyltransferase
MRAVLLRDASVADAPAVTNLLGQLGYPDAEASVRQRLERLAAGALDRVVVAEVDGTVLGLIGLHVAPYLHRDGNWLRITALVVADPARGRGIGRALMAEAEATAIRWGCDQLEVTSGRHRPDAHRFYADLGYEETSTRSGRFLKKLE